jgi:MinD superfamily P-loop ATPase containing an inserted ferredoxin domain
MKQLLVISGKGGTGKTTVSAAFIRLYGIRAYADTDVEAPNLHLVEVSRGKTERRPYYGGKKAAVNMEVCISCNKCGSVCRFGAIKDGVVEEALCEGCGACTLVCPSDAISLINDESGFTELKKGDKCFSSGSIKSGRGNSGKLVSAVKSNLLKNAEGEEIALIDGPPGIGCPVISAFSGVDLALIVTEEGKSGLSDLRRLLKLCQANNVKAAVMLNKAGDGKEYWIEKIKEVSDFYNAKYIGAFPYRKACIDANNSGYSLVDKDDEAARLFKSIFDKAIRILNGEDRL